MSKKNLQENFEQIIRIIKDHKEEMSVDDLLKFLPISIPKRTLQYRLSILVNSDAVKTSGSGRNTKYYIETKLTDQISSIRDTLKDDTTLIPLSKEALEVKKLILEPIQLRKHVSYQKDFLYSYQPNKTFYLSESLREKLLNFGNGADRGRPAGTYARKIYQRLLIDLSWNSSRLEGNTYSLLETEKLLETGEGLPGKNREDTQMILNHKEAIEFIVDMAEELTIQRYTILNIHGLLSHDLLLDPKACGRLRTIPVKIGKSVDHPVEVPQLIEEFFQVIVDKAALIKDPFEQSFFLLVHLPYLQPFLDVNKRVSRLAANIPLIRENLSPLSFVDVPETEYIQGLLAIYELNRIELFRDVFVFAYERSASHYLATLEAMGEPDPFKVLYRNLIRRAICEVVQNKMNKEQGAKAIQRLAHEHIPQSDRSRFIELAEVEILSLHEGNFARFRIRPSEFFEWQKCWK